MNAYAVLVALSTYISSKSVSGLIELVLSVLVLTEMTTLGTTG